MDERTYTAEDLAIMTPRARNNVLLHATKIEGTVLVRDKEGRPKYDSPGLAGSYNEHKLQQE